MNKFGDFINVSWNLGRDLSNNSCYVPHSMDEKTNASAAYTSFIYGWFAMPGDLT